MFLQRLQPMLTDPVRCRAYSKSMQVLGFSKRSHRSPCIHHTKEIHMNQDQIKGRMDQAKGKFKEVTGKLMGDNMMQSAGKLDQTLGQARSNLGDLKERARNSFQSLVK